MAPQAPCPTTEDEKERHNKHRGIRIRHEERFRVGLVGEDSLDSMSD